MRPPVVPGRTICRPPEASPVPGAGPCPWVGAPGAAHEATSTSAAAPAIQPHGARRDPTPRKPPARGLLQRSAWPPRTWPQALPWAAPSHPGAKFSRPRAVTQRPHQSLTPRTLRGHAGQHRAGKGAAAGHAPSAGPRPQHADRAPLPQATPSRLTPQPISEHRPAGSRGGAARWRSSAPGGEKPRAHLHEPIERAYANVGRAGWLGAGRITTVGAPLSRRGSGEKGAERRGAADGSGPGRAGRWQRSPSARPHYDFGGAAWRPAHRRQVGAGEGSSGATCVAREGAAERPGADGLCACAGWSRRGTRWRRC